MVSAQLRGLALPLPVWIFWAILQSPQAWGSPWELLTPDSPHSLEPLLPNFENFLEGISYKQMGIGKILARNYKLAHRGKANSAVPGKGKFPISLTREAQLCHGTPPVQGRNIFHHISPQQAWERVLTWQTMTPVTLKRGTQPTQGLAFSFSLAMVANSNANAHANGHAGLFLSPGHILASLLW